MATQFNEVVAVDLKHFRRGIYFLHLIDLHTRFSLAKIIKSKHPSVIVRNVIMMWVANGFGTPEKLLIGSGGEFANESFKEMAEQFNVEICSTAAESPWQNGICERNHAVIDTCVEKSLEDDPTIELDVALAWAVNAKNAIFNCKGFSPYQPVLGQNPNSPSAMTNHIPALEGVATNALHSVRKAYIKAV